MLQVQRQEQIQKLALTQSMQVSIKILQLSSAELAEHVSKELLENPFLEATGPGAAPVPTAPATAHGSVSDPIARLAETQTMEQNLLAQIGLMKLGARQRKLAENLVYCLDERGFLSEDLRILCEVTGALPIEITDILKHLQQCEPTGVFARDLAECLRLQLMEINRYDSLIAPLLHRLDLVAAHDLDGICNHCNVDREDAREMIADICKLNARPCAELETFRPGENPPDLILIQDGAQSIRAELNPASFPKILVNDGLFSTVQKGGLSTPDEGYYRDCYKRAGWLVAALQKRANTMLAIGGQLAVLQRAFILSGKNHDLVPLQMDTIGANLRLNKSTISRALAHRSIQTDHGIVDARMFFVRKANANLENATVEDVLHKLTSIIKSESIYRIYSDEQISQKLMTAKMPVRRRTVSKYRQVLNIPSAAQRKKNIVACQKKVNRVRFHL